MTKLLSEEKIKEIWSVTCGNTQEEMLIDFARRAIEAAVLEAQGKQKAVAEVVKATGSLKDIHIIRGMNEYEAKEGDKLYAAPVVQPNRRRLHNDIAEVVAKQLHYFDNVEKINGATTAKEVSDILEGGIAKYRNDAVFHAKVCSLVAHLTQVIAAAEGKDNAVAHREAACGRSGGAEC